MTIKAFYDGIWLDGSSNNSVSGNNITANNGYGIIIYESSDNIIYHNNFIDNTQQVDLGDYVLTNVWDNGYPPGGNYWSDYEERYPNATEIDGSCTWDTPYVIYENNQDNYPLMNPWTSIPPAINSTVDIIPNTLNLRSKAGYVTAFIELSEGYNISDTDVSSILLNNTIAVDPDAPTAIGDYDDDGIPDLMVKFNGTEVMAYIIANVNMTKLYEKRFMTITLTITGKLNDGTQFQGSDTIRIMMPMRRGAGRHSFLK